MRKSKIVWVYTSGIERRSCFGDVLEHLSITFRPCVLCDAADRVASAVRNEPALVKYYSDRAATIRAKNADGATTYYASVSYSAQVEMKAQRNLAPKDYGLEWYALSLAGGKITPHTLRGMSKLALVDSPLKAIEALKAIPVTYAGEMDAWVACETPAYLRPVVSTAEVSK